MGLKLVLAEKPSVGQSYARVLGAQKRCDGYLEGNGYVVSWCIEKIRKRAKALRYRYRVIGDEVPLFVSAEEKMS